jgi:hypothetical protein
MGAGASGLATETAVIPASNQRVRVVLPILSDVYERVSSKKRKRDDIENFINNPGRIKGVVDWTKASMDSISAIVSHTYNFPQMLHLQLTMDDDPVLMDYSQGARSEIIRMLLESMRDVKPCLIPFGIHLVNPKTMRGHANTGVIRYTPRRVVCIIFEPHGTESVNNQIKRRVFDEFIESVIATHYESLSGLRAALGMLNISKSIIIPHTRIGLQKKDSICVAWSILMYCIYMLNCETGCNFGRVQAVMSMLWINRKKIMPAFMYTLEQYMVMSEPGMCVTGLTPSIKKGNIRRMADSALDAAGCSDRGERDCTFPCEFDGVCFNKLLFSNTQECPFFKIQRKS